MTIATWFIHTLYHFDAFSGTNLLTRCRSVSSCFLLFLVSEILHRKYSRNWTKQKATFLFFQGLHGVRRRDEGGPRGVHTIGGRGPPLGRATRWGPHLGTPPTSPLRLYMLPDVKTLKQSTIFHEEFRSRRHREDKFRGTEVSVPARRRDGELPPESSPSTPSPSSSPLLSPKMRRE